MRTLFLSLAFAAMAAGSAMAQSSGASLTLQDAAKAPARIIIDGAVWKCSGASCVASGGDSQVAERACRRVVAKLGPVTAFTWDGKSLSAQAIAVCNGGK